MKSKKKFLLLGVGVMGALALGVGATSTFAWFQATKASATKLAAETGSVGVAEDTLSNNNLYIVPALSLVKSDEEGATSTNQVSMTDWDGETYVAVSDGGGTPKYYAASATRAAGVGTYLKLNITFKVYTFSHANDVDHDGVKDDGESDWTWSDTYLLSAADAALKAAHANESYTYHVDMTGRGKIAGTSAATMYAVSFNSTGSAVTAGAGTPKAKVSVAASTVSSVTGLTATIKADGTIDAASTLYVGIDGSQYTCDVSAGDECFTDGVYNVSTNAGPTTTASLVWNS